MTVADLQRRLAAMGEDPGPADGVLGPKTLAAINAVLDRVQGVVTPPPTGTTVPTSWMPWAKMDRIIVHWTAGTYKASSTDREHYHILVEGDGSLVRGDRPITANAAPIRGAYAAHTLNCNTGSIGVSLCCMAGAKEQPFDAGRYPMTRTQWDVLMLVVADLAERYTIPVLPGTVLSHAEVEKTLGIKQRQKWDYTRLAFDPSLKGAKEIGDHMRAVVKTLL